MSSSWKPCLAPCVLLPAMLGIAAAQDLPASLRGQLDALNSGQREQVHRRSAVLSAMPAARREALKQRIADWEALPADERRRRRERWQAWQALPAEARVRMQSAADAFAALDVQEQLALRKRFEALDLHRQRGWLLGAELGADWEQLYPLLMYTPAGQRDALLEALRAMSEQQRADLGVLAQRTPPQSRDGLRKQLLATPAAGRGRWLVEQLER